MNTSAREAIWNAAKATGWRVSSQATKSTVFERNGFQIIAHFGDAKSHFDFPPFDRADLIDVRTVDGINRWIMLLRNADDVIRFMEI